MKTNFLCASTLLIILITGCINKNKKPAIIAKDVDFEILVDSFNLYSEVSFCGLYFRVINSSSDNVCMSFNTETDTLSKKSLVLMTPSNDTIPIWYPDSTIGINCFLADAETTFIGMIEKEKFMNNYLKLTPLKSEDRNFMKYLKEIVSNSKIMYTTDYSKSMKTEFTGIDTIVFPRSEISINAKKIKFVYHSDTYVGGDDWKFISESL